MMDDNDIQDLIQREAFTIWQVRTRCGLSGSPDGDWKQAEVNVRKKYISEILNVSVANRLEKYF
jgi:hypothetical protein